MREIRIKKRWRKWIVDLVIFKIPKQFTIDGKLWKMFASNKSYHQFKGENRKIQPTQHSNNKSEYKEMNSEEKWK